MYLWWSLCTLYLHACQVRVTAGDTELFAAVLVLRISTADYSSPCTIIIIELIRKTASILFSISTTPEDPDSPLKYWLSHSTKIRPGMPLEVSVYLSNTTGTVTLRVELVDRQGKQLQDGQEFVLHGAGIVVSLVLFRISLYPCLSIPLPKYLHKYIVCWFLPMHIDQTYCKKTP